jgi:O-acetyl-ADP-ribose deacetylase (regulator of RNase III)
MGQFLQTNGDYNIKTREGGKIILDTGPALTGGEVVITGNLTVEGEAVYVEATELNVEDRIITVNFGETGAGISGVDKFSGIEVDRGSLPNVDIVWNDSATPPSWEFRQFDFDPLLNETAFVNSRLKIAEILTDSDTDSGNLKFLGSASPSGVLHVSGTSNYRQSVEDFGADAIPNKDYVDYAIENNPTFQITRTDTRVIAFDSSSPLVPPPSELEPVGPFIEQPENSIVAVVVDNQRSATFYSDKTTLGTYLDVFDEPPTDPLSFDIPNTVVLQAKEESANIKLETSGSGRVQITYAMQLDNQNIEPTAIPDTTMVYAGSIGTGKTGLYHMTYNDTVADSIAGELVNKQRALLFAMIF